MVLYVIDLEESITKPLSKEEALHSGFLKKLSKIGYTRTKLKRKVDLAFIAMQSSF